MSNSPLVVFTKISPNKTTPRNKPITKITPHHVAGNITIETIGNVFAPSSAQASSNYGVGTDGRIGMYVEEKDRAWTSSSAANDHQAVTMEVANNSGAPNWTVSDAAFAALVDLCVDICRRNPGIKQKDGRPGIYYDGTPNGSLTHHKMFSNTSCPGGLLVRFPELCDKVNAKLNGAVEVPPAFQELTSVNDIVWELADARGIITNKEYWLQKLEEDVNAYWLARKCLSFMQQRGV